MRMHAIRSQPRFQPLLPYIRSENDPLAEGANTQAKLVGCIKHFFWDFAQNYFPASAYNVDAEWTYEDTWANKNSWKEVNPLSQALSGHFEAERDWVTMRMLFMSSYFNFGAFTHTGYNDASTGQMVYGGADAHTFEITPAVSINPTIIRGSTETITYGDRVKANETAPLTVSDASGDDTRVYVQGLDYIKDLGDLKDLKVSAKNPTLSVASKRLQSLKVGDADASKVPTSGTISNLSFGDCPSLMVIDAQNLGTLVGAVDLSLLPRLKEALFGGTNVKTIGLPSGSKIERFQIPDSLTALDMQNLKFLNEEGFEYGTLGNIEFFRIENCDNIDKFALLKSMYLADGSKLKNIRVVGFNYEGNADDVTMVANMAIDKDKDGNEHFYNGINQEGQIDEEMLPVIEGKLKVNGSIYEDDGKVLKQYYPNLTLEVTGGYYVKFADPEVQRILVENFSSDGVGMTSEDIAKVTSIGTKFKSNSTIETFDELVRFINVTALSHDAFQKCSKLKYIALDNIKTIGSACFYNCPSLDIDVNLPQLTSIGNYSTFYNTKIKRVLSLGSITSLPNSQTTYPDYGIFSTCTELEKVVLPDTLTSIGAYTFNQCSVLSEINFPLSLKTISSNAFYNCTSLEIEDLNLPNLETLGQNAFYGVKIKKISDLGKLTALPTASTSTQNFGDKNTLEEVVLPETVTSIPANSFYGYTLLKKCLLPINTNTIGNYCLYNCLSLETVNLNDLGLLNNIGINAFENALIPVDLKLNSVQTIGERAFRNSGVLSVELNSITTISRDAFASCVSLERAILGVNCGSIGNGVFYKCNSLLAVVVKNITPPTLGSNVFGNTNNCSIYVPDASVEAYKTATNWSSFASRIKGISELQTDNAELYEEIKDYLN